MKSDSAIRSAVATAISCLLSFNSTTIRNGPSSRTSELRSTKQMKMNRYRSENGAASVLSVQSNSAVALTLTTRISQNSAV